MVCVWLYNTGRLSGPIVTKERASVRDDMSIVCVTMEVVYVVGQG